MVPNARIGGSKNVDEQLKDIVAMFRSFAEERLKLMVLAL